MKFSKKYKSKEQAAAETKVETKTTVKTGASETPERKQDIKRKKQQPERQHKVINSLVGNLSQALEENANEIDELLAERPREKEYHDRKKRPAKYMFFLIFGLLMFWLAIIGTLDVINTVREFAYNIKNQTALKEEFASFTGPVVMNDPPEFTGTDNLQSSTVIASAIWQIILAGDTANYERRTDNAYLGVTMTIPEADVEAAARSIFGGGFDITHRTIDNIATAFVYAPESKSYIVPENPSYFTFSPQIAEIEKNGDIYRIKVDYIAPSPQSIMGIEYEIEPVKTMIYTIQRLTDRSKILQSIEFNKIERNEELNY